MLEWFASLFVGTKDERLLRKIAEEDLDGVNQLLKDGADANSRRKADPGELGSAAIFVAAEVGNAPIAKVLIDAGADPNTEDGDENTLSCAITKDSDTTVQVLLNAGADPNKTTRDGDTPLVRAARKGSRKIFKMLLSAGADVHGETGDGATPLIAAARSGNVDVLDDAVNAGADLNHAEASGATALFAAVQEGEKAAVSRLIAAGADPNNPDKNGVSPIMLAVFKEQGHMVSELLEVGAQANVKANGNASVFQSASIGRHIERAAQAETQEDMMAMLIGSIGDIMKIATGNDDNQGEVSPLSLAVQSGSEEVVRALLEAGADPNLDLDDSPAPVSVAIEKDYEKIAQMLRTAGAQVPETTTQPEQANAKQTEVRNAVCDVCSCAVQAGSGVTLTTRQVVTSTGYWEVAFFGGPASAAQLPDDMARAACEQSIAHACSQTTGWLVCDECVDRFPDIDRDHSKAVAKAFWESGGDPDFPVPGAGAVEPSLGKEAARKLWKSKTGISAPF